LRCASLSREHFTLYTATLLYMHIRVLRPFLYYTPLFSINYALTSRVVQHHLYGQCPSRLGPHVHPFAQKDRTSWKSLNISMTRHLVNRIFPCAPGRGPFYPNCTPSRTNSDSIMVGDFCGKVAQLCWGLIEGLACKVVGFDIRMSNMSTISLTWISNPTTLLTAIPSNCELSTWT
jgi:hypothetical protein